MSDKSLSKSTLSSVPFDENYSENREIPNEFLKKKKSSSLSKDDEWKDNGNGSESKFYVDEKTCESTFIQKEKSPVKKLPIPTQDRILVSKSKPEIRTASGIIIPASAINEDNRGLVVAVGPLVGSGSIDFTPDIEFIPRPGDMILFGQYAGTETSYEGVDYLLMRESDVLAILPK